MNAVNIESSFVSDMRLMYVCVVYTFGFYFYVMYLPNDRLVSTRHGRESYTITRSAHARVLILLVTYICTSRLREVAVGAVETRVPDRGIRSRDSSR